MHHCSSPSIGSLSHVFTVSSLRHFLCIVIITSVIIITLTTRNHVGWCITVGQWKNDWSLVINIKNSFSIHLTVFTYPSYWQTLKVNFFAYVRRSDIIFFPTWHMESFKVTTLFTIITEHGHRPEVFFSRLGTPSKLSVVHVHFDYIPSHEVACRIFHLQCHAGIQKVKILKHFRCSSCISKIRIATKPSCDSWVCPKKRGFGIPWKG